MKLTESARNDFSDLVGLSLKLDWEEVKRDRTKRAGDIAREETLSRH